MGGKGRLIGTLCCGVLGPIHEACEAPPFTLILVWIYLSSLLLTTREWWQGHSTTCKARLCIPPRLPSLGSVTLKEASHHVARTPKQPRGRVHLVGNGALQPTAL